MWFDLDNKQFRVTSNEGYGKMANPDTIAHIKHATRDVVHCEYYHGGIKYGVAIGVYNDDHIVQRHLQISENYEITSGEGIVEITQMPDGKLHLAVEWEWGNGTGQGVMHLDEI